MTKMNTNFIAESDFEIKVENLLIMLRKSDETTKLYNKLKTLIREDSNTHFISRIKSTSSAIRTIRLRDFRSLQDANDYIGISFITQNDDEIDSIVNGLKNIFPNADHVNLLSEKSLYTKLHHIKKAPPLCYLVFDYVKIENETDVPMEIRVCSKEMFLSLQPTYYEIYKNDQLDLPKETKTKLKAILHNIFYKILLIDMREEMTLTEKTHQYHLCWELYEKNRDLLEEHIDIVKNCIGELAKHIYEYKVNNKFILGYKSDNTIKNQILQKINEIEDFELNIINNTLDILEDVTKNNKTLSRP